MIKSILTINECGTIIWYNDKRQYHRENDKPAVIYPDGIKFWWVNGKLHRGNNKPAVIFPNGYKQWWVDGYLHRDNNKPAVICSDGSKEWWIKGERISENI